MKNVVCWNPQEVYAIINPEAESVPDYVFRGVHSPQVLRVAQPVGDHFQLLKPSAFKLLAEEEFLREFLRADRPHVQVAVYGRSGSGKSHLIHWLQLHVPRTQSRLVLTIPKAGTSLRAIVKMIIAELPEDAQPQFLDTFALAGDSTLTRDGQKHELLNQIAQAVREDTAITNDKRDLEDALLRYLPDLFQDPELRRAHFLRDDGIVSKLVDHVYAANTRYEPSEERHRFQADEFPISGTLFAAASKSARDAMQILLLDERNVQFAADIVNRVLDAAIGRALSFSGDRVSELMTKLRRYLKSQGTELVLLIEDIARLQGIDRALLQALLTQGDSNLCNIRWAIAATTGFFETIADTVYTRMTFLVDMDRSATSESGKMSAKSLADFAGRYLNAVRLGREALSEWAEVAQAGESVENACLRCSYKDECHAVFGASGENVGLYPFTRKALWNMTARADEELEDRFNPRVLQRSVLDRVLDTYSSDLKDGKFPPRALLDDLGGIKALGAGEQERLANATPAREFNRALTLQELWDGSSTVRRFPPLLLEAFSLSDLDSEVREAASPDLEEPQAATHQEPVVDRRLAALDAWASGGPLEQSKITNLREIVYDAIYNAIDWDAEGLVKATFAGAVSTRPFKRVSIYFQRQDTNYTGGTRGVRLAIPADGSDESAFRKTALALQGLILASDRNRNGEWTFPGGFVMLSALEDCLSQWTAEVLKQLKALPGANDAWEPVSGAVELLGVGACLAGRLKPDSELTDMLNAALEEWPQESGIQTRDLQKIFTDIRNAREKLVDLIRSVASGTKGGKAGAFLDPAVVAPALQRLRRNSWQLRQTPPAEPVPYQDWGMLAKLYRATANALERATETERSSRLQWLTEMEAAFGTEPKRADILATLSAARQAVVDARLGGAARIGAFTKALEDLQGAQLDDAVRAASMLRGEECATALLPNYGRGRQNATVVGTQLAIATRDFLTKVDAELENLELQFRQGAGSLPSDLDAIAASLKAIAWTEGASL